MLAVSSPQAIYTLAIQAQDEGDPGNWRRLIAQCRDWLIARDEEWIGGTNDDAASTIAPHSFRHPPTFASDFDEFSSEPASRTAPRGHTIWP